MRKFVSVFVMLFLCSMVAFPQTSPVTGQVKNESREPLSFATINIKGSSAAVSEDQNGIFTIQEQKWQSFLQLRPVS